MSTLAPSNVAELQAEPEDALFVHNPNRPRESLGVMLVRYLRFVAGWTVTLSFAVLCLALSILGMRRFAYLSLGKRWSYWVLRSCGIRLNVEGAHNLKGPAIFMSNHHSFIDVIFVVTLIPSTSRFVVRKELRQIPFWGWAAGDGLIALDRAKGGALDALQNSLDELPQGWSVSIYPEGTRTKTGHLGKLRKGIVYLAVQSRMPIVPVGSWGAASIIPLKTLLPRSGPIEVTAGEAISTEHWSIDTMDQHLEELRTALLKVTNASRARFEEKYGPCEPDRRVGSMMDEWHGHRPPPAPKLA